MKPTITKITDKWIKQNEPCPEALVWYKDYLGKSPKVILNRLIKAKKYDWANWFIVRVMKYKDYVSYAIFAAEQVIEIYEKKYPDDKRPREAIEAAKKCIENPSEENKTAAWAAGAAAGAARAAAGAAWAARAAAWAAWAARAAWAAAWAAWAAAWAAEAARKLKILKYGMKLLK